MKTFKFVYLDNKGNELLSTSLPCSTKKEAEKLAKRLFAESMINDLKKVVVR